MTSEQKLIISAYTRYIFRRSPSFEPAIVSLWKFQVTTKEQPSRSLRFETALVAASPKFVSLRNDEKEKEKGETGGKSSRERTWEALESFANSRDTAGGKKPLIRMRLCPGSFAIVCWFLFAEQKSAAARSRERENERVRERGPDKGVTRMRKIVLPRRVERVSFRRYFDLPREKRLGYDIAGWRRIGT